MFPYTNPSSSSSTTLHDQAPSPPFFPFSLSFLDDLDDGFLVSHLLSHHHSLSMINNAPPAPVTDPLPDHQRDDQVVITAASPTPARTNVTSTNIGDERVMIPKKIMRQHKKTGKKDRHSKICTAQGMRDRRMRLSVKVARKFFDLQDMLDFDKASKTIEWLLMNSKDAIQNLAAQSQLQQQPEWNISSTNGHEKSMSSSASVSEVVSQTNKEMETMQTGEESVEPKPKRKRKSCRVAISVSPLARESRDMARARARERTTEKMMVQRSHNTQSTDQSTLKNSKKDSGFTHAIGDHMDATRIEPTACCYAMTSRKSSLGNAQVQNMSKNILQEHNKPPSTSPPSSIFSNHGYWNNPSSFFVSAPNTQDHQQNPIPNPFYMSTAPNALQGIINPVFSPTNSSIGFESHHFLGNQFQ